MPSWVQKLIKTSVPSKVYETPYIWLNVKNNIGGRLKIEAIESFTADDITVEKGSEKQDVVIYESVQPVDAMEKLYMKVEVA